MGRFFIYNPLKRRVFDLKKQPFGLKGQTFGILWVKNLIIGTYLCKNRFKCTIFKIK